MDAISQLVVDENNIAFHPMMGNSYKLNDIAREIIVMLKHHKTKEEIIEKLLEEYDVDESQLFIDVSDFLTKMKIYGILS